MKKFLFALVAGTILTLAGLNLGHAQTMNSSELGAKKNVIETNYLITPEKNHADELENVNPKAMKRFAKKYKNVTGERWMKIKNGFSVKFSANGIANTVFYISNGEWAFSIKAYSEDKLPFKVRDIVKRKYYDYSIFYIEEVENINSNGIPTYIVHIEDKNNIKLARVCDGEMDIMEEYNKSY